MIVCRREMHHPDRVSTKTAPPRPAPRAGDEPGGPVFLPPRRTSKRAREMLARPVDAALVRPPLHPSMRSPSGPS